MTDMNDEMLAAVRRRAETLHPAWSVAFVVALLLAVAGFPFALWLWLWVALPEARQHVGRMSGLPTARGWTVLAVAAGAAALAWWW